MKKFRYVCKNINDQTRLGRSRTFYPRYKGKPREWLFLSVGQARYFLVSCDKSSFKISGKSMASYQIVAKYGKTFDSFSYLRLSVWVCKRKERDFKEFRRTKEWTTVRNLKITHWSNRSIRRSNKYRWK